MILYTKNMLFSIISRWLFVFIFAKIYKWTSNTQCVSQIMCLNTRTLNFTSRINLLGFGTFEVYKHAYFKLKTRNKMTKSKASGTTGRTCLMNVRVLGVLPVADRSVKIVLKWLRVQWKTSGRFTCHS